MSRIKIWAGNFFFSIRFWFAETFFSWVQDNDGDLGLAVCGGLIVFLKYKDGTIIEFGKKYAKAGKFQGYIEKKPMVRVMDWAECDPKESLRHVHLS